MSRTFKDTHRRTDRTPRPQLDARAELAEILAELSDADLALNERVWGAAPASSSRTNMLAALEEARLYGELLDRARAAHVPTSLGDPRSPRTVASLAAAVEQAEMAA